MRMSRNVANWLVILFITTEATLIEIPASDFPFEFLEFYNANEDEFIGLQLASGLHKDLVSSTTIDQMNIENYVCTSDNEYSSTLNLDVNAEGNLLIRMLDGSANFDLTMKKFTSSTRKSILGLIVAEKVTKIDKLDPCRDEIHENLHFYSTFQDNFAGTHVLIGKRYKLRAELGFVFDTDEQKKYINGTADIKVKVREMLNAFVASVKGRGELSNEVTEFLSTARYQIRSNLNINLPIPDTVPGIRQVLETVSSFLSGTTDFGSVSHYILQDLKSVSVCQALNVASVDAKSFTKDIVQVLKETINFYENLCVSFFENLNQFASLSSCFTTDELIAIAIERIIFEQEVYKRKASFRLLALRYRSGNLTETAFHDSLGQKLIQDAQDILNFTRTIESKFSTNFQKLALLMQLKKNGIKCWPVKERNIMLDSIDGEGMVKLMLFNGSNPFHYTFVTKIEDFLYTCSKAQCDNCTCYAVDCNHAFEICKNISEVTITSLPQFGKARMTYPDEIRSAFYYMYEKHVVLDFLVNMTMLNLNQLHNVIEGKKSVSTPRSLNLTKLWTFAFGKGRREMDSPNPIEKLLGKRIPIFQNYTLSF